MALSSAGTSGLTIKPAGPFERQNRMDGESALASQKNHEEDLFLVKAITSGDDDAFSRLFEKYRLAVHSLCYRFTRNAADAEDLTQEVFVKVYHKIRTFDARAKFFTWLYRVTINHCISFRRKRPPALDAIEPKEAADFTRQIELRIMIDRAMLALPRQQRMVFVLRHYQQLSFDEIGEAMGISTGAAKAHHHFAVHKLREFFSEARSQSWNVKRSKII
jgi:RNA polymerase sigma-70 factor (ECF subfamily)